MQLTADVSVCPICGSHQSGGHALINSPHARCPACQASSPVRPPKGETFLGWLRNRFAPQKEGRLELPSLKIWG